MDRTEDSLSAFTPSAMEAINNLGKLSIHLVRESVYYWLSVWEKKYASGNHVSTSSCMLRIEKLITYLSYTIYSICLPPFHSYLFKGPSPELHEILWYT